MKTQHIYILRDPRNGEIRYVGKTQQTLRRRLLGHVSCRDHEWHVCRWIRELWDLGHRPMIESVATWEDDALDWKEQERHYVKFFRDQGCNLTNLSEGGDYLSCTDEDIEKIRRACTGRKHSEETKAKIGLAHKGRKQTLEARANMSAGQRGRKHPPEVLAKLRAHRHTDEAKAKMSGKRLGRPKSAEHRAKIGESHRGPRSAETLALCAATRRINTEMKKAMQQ